MQLWKVSFVTTREAAESLAVSMEDEAVSVSWAEVPADPWQWQVDAIFDFEPAQSQLQFSVNSTAALLGVVTPDVRVEMMPDKNWLAENRAAFKPLEIGQFFIYGSHYDQPLPQDKKCLLIEASTAFGTGQHETTHGCLTALQDLAKEGHVVSHALDLGCGTAILAFAMAHLFPDAQVWASDNDPEAVDKAKENTTLNGYENRLQVLVSEGFEAAALQQAAPYQLIAANILAAPLIELAPHMVQHTAPKGFVVLSGLLISQSADVLKAYEAEGLTIHRRYFMGEWATLVLRRS